MLQVKSTTQSEDELRMDWSLEMVIYSQIVVCLLPKDSISHEDQFYSKMEMVKLSYTWRGGVQKSSVNTCLSF